VKVDLPIVAFGVQNVHLHIKDEYIILMIVKIRKVDLATMTNKAPTLVQDLEIS